MFEAVHDVTSRSLSDYAGRPRHEWVLDWPGMVVLVVTACYWTQGGCSVFVGVSQGWEVVKSGHLICAYGIEGRGTATMASAMACMA
jgi:hypothetical protein